MRKILNEIQSSKLTEMVGSSIYAFGEEDVDPATLPPPSRARADVQNTVDLSEVGKSIDLMLQKTCTDMTSLVQQFERECPPQRGKIGGYLLSEDRCGREGCRLCPHRLVWRMYDYHAIPEVYDDPAAYAHDFTISTVIRAGYQDQLPIKPFEEPLLEGKPRGPLKKKGSFWWHRGKHPKLPPAFYKIEVKTPYIAAIRRFSKKMLLLNRRRKMLGEMRVKIIGMERSLRTNKVFRDPEGMAE